MIDNCLRMDMAEKSSVSNNFGNYCVVWRVVDLLSFLLHDAPSIFGALGTSFSAKTSCYSRG